MVTEEREKQSTADKTTEKIIMEITLTYSLTDQNNEELESGEGSAVLTKEQLILYPNLASLITITYQDILEINQRNYKLEITLISKDKLFLSKLGSKYDDFTDNLSVLYSQLLIKHLLMEEQLKISALEGELAYINQLTQKPKTAQCQLRLYETALVILTANGEITRIPYSIISETKQENYSLFLTLEHGEQYVLKKMGRNFDSFITNFFELNNQLLQKTQSLLKQVLPQANPLQIRKLSQLLRDGKCAAKNKIDQISPQIWSGLEQQIFIGGLEQEYRFLKKLGQKEKICIGIKRGLLGDLTGEYIWLLVPIYSLDSSQPGNAIALEAASTAKGQGGMATYFFKITDRQNYKNFSKLEDLEKQVDELIQTINHCLLTINFRREPIYLSENDLAKPQHSKYKTAINRLPQLQKLRSLFLGRIIHSSQSQWEKDTLDLLSFNISTTNDLEHWKKTK